MRLNLYWRGRDVIDIEAHVWRRRDQDPETEPPVLMAAPNLAASEIAWWLLLAAIAGIEAGCLYGVWWLGHQNPNG